MATSKICTIGSSDDGDRIFCLYKEGNETMAKGFYDFNKHTFIVTEFYSRKLTPFQTPRNVIMELKQILDEEMDWSLNNEEKLIQHIEEGMNTSKKIKKKKRNKKQIK